MSDFAKVLARTPVGELRWAAEITPDWAQGRTSFGGLVAALAAETAHEVAQLAAPGQERPVRSIDVAFVAPLPVGPVGITAEVLGAGRSVTQVSVSLFGADGTLATRAHVVLGASRAGRAVVSRGPVTPPGPGDPLTQGFEVPFLEGITPTCTQHIEFRWCGDNFLFTGSGPEATSLRGWCRHRTEASGVAAVVALLDAWPPAVLPMATGPTQNSTIRWSIQLVGDRASRVQPGDWLWFESAAVSAGEGYAVETDTLFLHGEPLVWAEQTVAVYEQA